MSMSFPHLVVVIVAVMASVSDLRTSRIPNGLTFGAALAAALYALATGGWWGIATAAGGWAVGVLVFLPFFALGGLGAGDVKLLAGIGAWLGPGDTLWVAMYGSIAGGVMAIAVAVAKGYLRQALKNIALLLTHWRVVGIRPLQELSLENDRAPRLAYALPIAAGVLVTLWLK